MEARLLQNAVIHSDLATFKNILAEHELTAEILFFAAKTIIRRNNKSDTDNKMAELIIKNKRFNPDLIETESITIKHIYFPGNTFTYETNHQGLIEIALKEKNYHFLNLILKHPLLDLTRVKNKSFSNILELKYFDLVDYLLNNPRFFYLENDWSKWGYSASHNQINETFIKILAMNLSWHKCKELRPSFLIYSCQDALFEIAKNLYKILYQTNLNTLFTKKKEHENTTQNTHTSYPDFTCRLGC